jgi:hypothetical protein
MRYILAALLAASPAVANEFQTGDDLQATVKAECADGCVVFNKAAIVALDAVIRQFIAAAHQAGKHEGSANCRL